LFLLVPGERIELPTNGLQNRCSTAELTRQANEISDLIFRRGIFAPICPALSRAPVRPPLSHSCQFSKIAHLAAFALGGSGYRRRLGSSGCRRSGSAGADSEIAELKTIIVGSLPLFEEPPEDWFGTETPITGAVGTDILARPDCRVLGLYGTGRQARRNLVAMCTIRPSIEVVRVYSRSAENRLGFVARMQPQVHARIGTVEAPCSGRERCRPHLPRHRQQRAGAVRRMARAGSTRHLDRCQQKGRFPAGFGITAAARVR
jgi:hypothetical protein